MQKLVLYGMKKQLKEGIGTQPACISIGLEASRTTEVKETY